MGGYDDAVILLNKEALAELGCKKELKIVPGDGIATGSTMRAAVRALNAQHPAFFSVIPRHS